MPRPKGKPLKIAIETVPGFEKYFVEGDSSKSYKPPSYEEEALDQILPNGRQMRSVNRGKRK